MQQDLQEISSESIAMVFHWIFGQGYKIESRAPSFITRAP
jgi:hypothetical protein